MLKLMLHQKNTFKTKLEQTNATNLPAVEETLRRPEKTRKTEKTPTTTGAAKTRLKVENMC